MKLSEKGPIAAPPVVGGLVGELCRVVQSWPDVIAATHWNLYRPDVPDGVDFYLGDSEIGHVHFDGEAHVATDKVLSQRFVALGNAQPFRFRADARYRHWTQVSLGNHDDLPGAVKLFRANYERLHRQ